MSIVDDLLMAATDCEGNRYGDLFTKAAATVEELEGVKAELLEALEEFVRIGDQHGWDNSNRAGDAMTAARAAIAKAKGETT